MDELLRLNLYSRVNAYLWGRFSQRDLEDWLLQNDPLLMQDPESEAARLAGLIDLGIVEISRGHISEEELREEIAHFFGEQVTIPILTFVEPQQTVTVTSSGSTVAWTGPKPTTAKPVLVK